MFFEKIKEICNKNKKVAMFVDMDGTIVEYKVYVDEKTMLLAKGEFLKANPVRTNN